MNINGYLDANQLCINMDCKSSWSDVQSNVTYDKVQNFSTSICPAGQAAYTRLQNGTFLCRVISAADTDTWWNISDDYYMDNVSQHLILNSTKLNATIDNRDTDTTIANCSVDQSCANIIYTTDKLGNVTTEIRSVFFGSTNISIDSGIISLNLSCETLTGSADLCDGSDDGAGAGNCSQDGSCANITYDIDLAYIANCSVDNSCGLITYDTELDNLNASNRAYLIAQDDDIRINITNLNASNRAWVIATFQTITGVNTLISSVNTTITNMNTSNRAFDAATYMTITNSNTNDASQNTTITNMNTSNRAYTVQVNASMKAYADTLTGTGNSSADIWAVANNGTLANKNDVNTQDSSINTTITNMNTSNRAYLVAEDDLIRINITNLNDSNRAWVTATFQTITGVNTLIASVNTTIANMNTSNRAFDAATYMTITNSNTNDASQNTTITNMNTSNRAYTVQVNASMKAYADSIVGEGNSSADIWAVANNGTLASIIYTNNMNTSNRAYDLATYMSIANSDTNDASQNTSLVNLNTSNRAWVTANYRLSTTIDTLLAAINATIYLNDSTIVTQLLNMNASNRAYTDANGGGNSSFNQTLTDSLYAKYNFSNNNFNGTGNNTADYFFGNTITPINSDSLVNKDYVDDIASAIAFDFFFTNHTSDISGHYDFSEIDEGHSESSLTSPSLSTGTHIIFNFSTQLGMPEFNKLRTGVYDARLHLFKTGTKDVFITPKLYNISADGSSKTLFLTFETSIALTTIDATYDLHATLSDEIILADGNRLHMEFVAEVSGGGSDPTVTLDMEGTTDTHMSVETSSNAFEQIFLRLDGNKAMTGLLQAPFGINTSSIQSKDWSNVSITEAQISDLVHTGNSSADIWAVANNGTLASIIYVDNMNTSNRAYDLATYMSIANSDTNDASQNTTITNMNTSNRAYTVQVNASMKAYVDATAADTDTWNSSADMHREASILITDVNTSRTNMNTSNRAYLTSEDNLIRINITNLNSSNRAWVTATFMSIVNVNTQDASINTSITNMNTSNRAFDAATYMTITNSNTNDASQNTTITNMNTSNRAYTDSQAGGNVNGTHVNASILFLEYKGISSWDEVNGSTVDTDTWNSSTDMQREASILITDVNTSRVNMNTSNRAYDLVTYISIANSDTNDASQNTTVTNMNTSNRAYTVQVNASMKAYVDATEVSGGDVNGTDINTSKVYTNYLRVYSEAYLYGNLFNYGNFYNQQNFISASGNLWGGNTNQDLANWEINNTGNAKFQNISTNGININGTFIYDWDEVNGSAVDTDTWNSSADMHREASILITDVNTSRVNMNTSNRAYTVQVNDSMKAYVDEVASGVSVANNNLQEATINTTITNMNTSNRAWVTSEDDLIRINITNLNSSNRAWVTATFMAIVNVNTQDASINTTWNNQNTTNYAYFISIVNSDTNDATQNSTFVSIVNNDLQEAAINSTITSFVSLANVNTQDATINTSITNMNTSNRAYTVQVNSSMKAYVDSVAADTDTWNSSTDMHREASILITDVNTSRTNMNTSNRAFDLATYISIANSNTNDATINTTILKNTTDATFNNLDVSNKFAVSDEFYIQKKEHDGDTDTVMNITQGNLHTILNTGGVFIIYDNLEQPIISLYNDDKTTALTGLLTAEAGLESYEDIYLTGAGDNLWGGASTQISANWEINSTGNAKFQNISTNGLSINGTPIYDWDEVNSSTVDTDTWNSSTDMHREASILITDVNTSITNMNTSNRAYTVQVNSSMKAYVDSVAADTDTWNSSTDMQREASILIVDVNTSRTNMNTSNRAYDLATYISITNSNTNDASINTTIQNNNNSLTNYTKDNFINNSRESELNVNNSDTCTLAEDSTAWITMTSLQSKWFADVSDVLTFDEGQFNDSIALALTTTYYNMTSISVVTGTGAGTLADINSHNEVSYNLTEDASDILFYLNSTGVIDFNQVLVFFETIVGEVDDIHIALWDCDIAVWETYKILSNTDGVFNEVSFTVSDPASHICSGVVSLRFNTTNEGTRTDKWLFDWVTLSKGVASAVGTELDPLAVHKSGDTPLTGSWDAGTYDIITRMFNGSWNGSGSYYTTTQIDTQHTSINTSLNLKMSIANSNTNDASQNTTVTNMNTSNRAFDVSTYMSIANSNTNDASINTSRINMNTSTYTQLDLKDSITNINTKIATVNTTITNKNTSDYKVFLQNNTVDSYELDGVIVMGILMMNSTHQCFDYPTNSHCTYYNTTHRIDT